MPENIRFNLERLLHPITPATFFGEYWEEKPLLVARNRADYYAPLLTLQQIDPLVTVLPPDTMTLTNSDAPLEVREFARADGYLDVVKACQLFAAGSTIVIQEAHNRLPSLAALARELEREIGAPFQTNLYLTPPQGKGFDTHYDTHDVYLLQIAGSKEWTIFDSPVRLPLRGQPFDENLHPVGAPTMSFVLHAGDFLYIPRGFLHHARSGDETSLHVTLGALAYRWADVLLEVMAQLCLADPAFRRALPVAGACFDGAAVRKTFTDLLARAVERANPDGVVEKLADEFVIGRRAFIPGQLEQVEAAQHLAASDLVGARPGSIYRLQTEGDLVRLRAHGREVRLPAEATDAVTFALQREQYRISDLPGDLDEDEKLTIVKRLIEEGLVWKFRAP